MRQSDLDAWFAAVQSTLEPAYIVHAEPWKQSGMSGPLERWTTLRKPVADCIDRSGSLLDIGCANGFLLQCCLGWTAEREVILDPHGVDLSPRLVALARQRLPAYAEQLAVENAFRWTPPRRYAWVLTELVYVPGTYERAYIDHLRRHYLEPDGRLLIANYAEGHPDPARGLLPDNHPTRFLLERLEELGVPVVGYRDGVDAVKGRITRVAIVPGLDVS